jgi:phage protein D
MFLSAQGEPVLQTLTFGAAVMVSVGYGDRASLVPIISGFITEITTNFDAGSTPELSIGGYDYLFAMTLGKVSKSWSQASDSDIVSELASGNNLDTDIDPTPERREQIEQNQESDYDLLKKLAERNHYEFYVDVTRTLRFGKPRDKDDGVVTLKWGESLLSFKPEANLASQVSSVEVYGWNPQTKEPIVGRATIHSGRAEASASARPSSSSRCCRFGSRSLHKPRPRSAPGRFSTITQRSSSPAKPSASA